MSKFNVGDMVVMVNVNYGFKWPDYFKAGVAYPVVGHWLHGGVEHPRVVGEHGTAEGWFNSNFELAEDQDDPLPPAPESALYNDEYHDRTAYKQTWLSAHPDCVDTLVVLQSGQYGEPHAGVGVRVSPDAALQLAHDLRRMAMELKRKEKI